MSQQYGASQQPINNFLIPAILVTVLCCQPLAIIGIVFAIMSKNATKTGDITKATQMAKYAKITTIILFVLGLVSWIAGIAIFFLFGGMAIINQQL